MTSPHTSSERTRRIAMWSGPRNISTALMRSWEARGDTAVVDEPFYGHYLQRTRRAHPGRELIVAACETDWQAIAATLTGPVPGERPIFYQKHMAHHLFPDLYGPWLDKLDHCFLIRDSREMLLSFAEVIDQPQLEDTGLPQQWRLFEYVRDELGQDAPIVDARDVLRAPAEMLRQLCEALAVAYTPDMLSWVEGRRETDGVWAPFWYAGVEASTGFRPYRPRDGTLPARLEDLLLKCRPYYERLYERRIQP